MDRKFRVVGLFTVLVMIMMSDLTSFYGK